jgi:hypothetical protein
MPEDLISLLSQIQFSYARPVPTKLSYSKKMVRFYKSGKFVTLFTKHSFRLYSNSLARADNVFIWYRCHCGPSVAANRRNPTLPMSSVLPTKILQIFLKSSSCYFGVAKTEAMALLCSALTDFVETSRKSKLGHTHTVSHSNTQRSHKPAFSYCAEYRLKGSISCCDCSKAFPQP